MLMDVTLAFGFQCVEEQLWNGIDQHKRYTSCAFEHQMIMAGNNHQSFFPGHAMCLAGLQSGQTPANVSLLSAHQFASPNVPLNCIHLGFLGFFF